MKYYIGIDTGGTFTDCAVINETGNITIAKRPSTPDDYSTGLFNALEACSEKIGINLETLLERTEHFFLGTTVGTNALLQMKGAKTGFITTRGHKDCLFIMRSAGRSVGLPIEKLLHVSRHQKPEPIIPRRLVCEISERVDWKGNAFLPFNEQEAEEAINYLVEQGIEAIGICLLWSIVNPDHELKLKNMIQKAAPHIFVSCSHELIAKRGEYERSVGTAINCFIGPSMKEYMEKIENRSASLGYEKPILVLQVTGGVVPSNEVMQTPLYTISSGPAGGVTGSSFLAKDMGYENAIITDMGGTSFETGIIHQGSSLTASETIINQYVFLMPRLDVQSIGSGGGSVLWIDEISGTLKVGPESAGADPGPACYGKGGKPTVTDANLVLGYLNPDNFLGGKIQLDTNKSVEAIKPLAEKLGMEVHEVAAGAVKIAESKMAELIRQMTLQRGLDPREFVIFAYGGAGPTHACQYAKELGIKRVVIPMGTISSAWSAFGTLCADILHVYEKSALLSQPFDLELINKTFETLESQGLRQLKEDGVEADKIMFQRFVEMKYRMQIHQLPVPVPSGQLSEDDLEKVLLRFEEIYESFYGKGSAYRDAGIEIGLFKVNAVGKMIKPKIPEQTVDSDNPNEGSRQIFWRDQGKIIETPVYLGQKLGTGQVVSGPAVIEYPETTVVIHPFAKGAVDPSGSFIIELEGEGI
ncbi:MAG: hydantoinase/oxoprolinase family protein [Nitrospina sp.]|jgi:N-methylhydantoinase A|nr:hydantoinase/oxoprolinase family protein [Nitrospina sp.]